MSDLEENDELATNHLQQVKSENTDDALWWGISKTA